MINENAKKDRRWSSFLELSFYINSNSLDIYKAKLLQENVFFYARKCTWKKPRILQNLMFWYSYDHLWEIPVFYYHSLINYLHVHMYWLVSNKDKRLTKLRYTYTSIILKYVTYARNMMTLLLPKTCISEFIYA